MKLITLRMLFEVISELGVLRSLGGGGGGGNTTTVQQADPWSGQQPYLQDIFKQAQNNYYNNAPGYYPNATYTPFSPQSEMAMQLTQNRALQGSPLNTSSQQVAQDTLDGAYLNSNPWLDQTFNRASQAVGDQFRQNVMPGIDSTFSKAGRLGSQAQATMTGQAADSYGNTLNSLATDIYGGNYATERQNQLNMAQLAPQLANIDYQDFAQLGNVGAAVEGKSGEMLNDQINRFNYYQNLPNQNLANYMGIVQGNYGGSSTSTVDTPSNTATNVLGGGIMGYSAAPAIGNALGMTINPWLGAAAGGLLGGLFS